MEVKKALESAEELERLSIIAEVLIEKLRGFAKALAKVAEIVVENFRRLIGCSIEYLRDSEKRGREKKHSIKTGNKPMKMENQVMCRKPRFMVRKIIR